MRLQLRQVVTRLLGNLYENGVSSVDPPLDAIVTIPPYGDEEIKNVYRIATNPGGDYPLRVWAYDGNGKGQYPYYATGIRFNPSNDQ